VFAGPPPGGVGRGDYRDILVVEYDRELIMWMESFDGFGWYISG
jgi:hypothetical protein